MSECLTTNDTSMEDDVFRCNALVVADKSHVTKRKLSVVIVGIPFVKNLTSVGRSWLRSRFDNVFGREECASKLWRVVDMAVGKTMRRRTPNISMTEWNDIALAFDGCFEAYWRWFPISVRFIMMDDREIVRARHHCSGVDLCAFRFEIEFAVRNWVSRKDVLQIGWSRAIHVMNLFFCTTIILRWQVISLYRRVVI